MQYRDHGWLVSKLRQQSLKSKTSIASYILLVPTLFFLISVSGVFYISRLDAIRQKELFDLFRETALEKLIDWIPYMHRIYHFLESRDDLGRYYLISNAYTVSIGLVLVSVALMVALIVAYKRENIYELDQDIINENLALRYPSYSRTTLHRLNARANFTGIVLLFSVVALVDILWGAIDINRTRGAGNIAQVRDFDFYRWAIQLWVFQLLSFLTVDLKLK